MDYFRKIHCCHAKINFYSDISKDCHSKFRIVKMNFIWFNQNTTSKKNSSSNDVETAAFEKNSL